ncbi:MAG: methyltransferase domain-containing protein [Methanobacteriota archaeon]|nr:MAG: methyltransferase domain-containing protein [Euryarchaeota archaeon]
MTEPEVYVLIDERERRHLVSTDRGMASIPGLGVLSIEKLRSALGRQLAVGDRSVLVLPANRRDRMEGLDRKAQVIGPKDAAAILFHGDIGPGSVVVEAGAGSAWLTVALASAVGSQGRVISYEERPDFAAVAEENLRRAGLLGRVTLRVADIAAGIPDRDVDAVVLDLPDPWTAVQVAWTALRIGGSVVTFLPNVEQVRQAVEALREIPFVQVRTLEIIEREIEVKETGTKPSFAPLGHTGYITTARKALDKFL